MNSLAVGTQSAKYRKAGCRNSERAKLEELRRQVESDYSSATKMFWQTIRRLRERRLGAAREVKSKDGTLLSNEKDILCRWREYFSELLNPVEGTEGDRTEISGGAESSPSVAEVAAAIGSLKSGKAAGVDEIRPDMLEALKEEGVLWLSRVIKVAWESGSVSKD